jgi:hypothetical protein
MAAVTAYHFSLQSTLSSGTAMSSLGSPTPHHPITCAGDLFFHDDGRFACEHAEVADGDERTVHCVQGSIAILILELARSL